MMQAENVDVDGVAVAASEPTPDALQPTAEPVALAERIRSLDVLRGVAVLGILLVNVWSFGLVFPGSLSPMYLGCSSMVDRVVALVTWLVAYNKLMPIFSMLFGAGILLISERLEARGLRPRNIVFRRQLWLLMFGLVHAYLLWDGDILAPYAVYGMIVFLFRKRTARTLIILGVLSTLLPACLMVAGSGFMAQAQAKGEAAEAAVQAGEPLTQEQRQALDMWREQRVGWMPTAEDIERLEAVRRSGYFRMLQLAIPGVLSLHLVVYPLVVGWLIAGMMLIGMALYKTGALSGARSPAFYRWMVGLGYVLGLPLVVVAFVAGCRSPGDVRTQMLLVSPIVNLSGPVVALGHIGLVVLATRNGWLGRLEARLAAAGRMAFTNYIAQTLICITLFYGFGFGLFGSLCRLELALLAVAIWILQLWWSPRWLEHFRFGPLEWLWRSLTYRHGQPMRRG
jgi:uncharacterized protein